MLLGKVGSTSAGQFALGFIPGYDLYSASQNPNASMLDYGIGILGILPGAGKGVGTAIRAGDNLIGAAARGINRAPDFIVSPGGTAFLVPKGATGPSSVINPAGNQTGVAFTGGAGGANGQVSTMRIMDSTPARGNRALFF